MIIIIYYFFQVEKIVGHRTVKNHRQFLVRWKGYSPSSDSWENEKDLNCPNLIEEFLAEQELKTSAKDNKEAKTKSGRVDKSKKSKGITKKQTEECMLFSLTLLVYANNIVHL